MKLEERIQELEAENAKLIQELKLEYLKETHLQRTFCGKYLDYWFNLEKEVEKLRKDWLIEPHEKTSEGFWGRSCARLINKLKKAQEREKVAVEALEEFTIFLHWGHGMEDKCTELCKRVKKAKQALKKLRGKNETRRPINKSRTV